MRFVSAGLLLLGAAAWAQPEVLSTPRYRAVTLSFEEKKLFTVPGVERITASSGSCLEESLDADTAQTVVITATCAGVRTSMVWLKDGTRIHVLACAEEQDPKPELKKLRAKLQAQLKGWKSATACVRNGRVELWGWVEKKEDKARISALAQQHSGGQVLDKVEWVEP